jgi:hypothetical protein
MGSVQRNHQLPACSKQNNRSQLSGPKPPTPAISMEAADAPAGGAAASPPAPVKRKRDRRKPRAAGASPPLRVQRNRKLKVARRAAAVAKAAADAKAAAAAAATDEDDDENDLDEHHAADDLDAGGSGDDGEDGDDQEYDHLDHISDDDDAMPAAPPPAAAAAAASPPPPPLRRQRKPRSPEWNAASQRIAIHFQFWNVFQGPPEHDWEGRGGAITTCIRNLMLPKGSRGVVRRVFAETVAAKLTGKTFDPAIARRRGRRHILQLDGEEALIAVSELEAGGTQRSATEAVNEHRAKNGLTSVSESTIFALTRRLKVRTTRV